MGPEGEHPDIVFSEETGPVRSFAQKSPPVLHRWIIRHSGGIINDSLHASYVLVVLAVLAVIASIFAYPKQDLGRLAPTEKAFLKQGGAPQSYDAALFLQ